jgi:hypothetical protein
VICPGRLGIVTTDENKSVYFIIFMYFFIENSPLPREGVGGTSGDFIWGKNINNQQTKKRKYEKSKEERRKRENGS